jgi:hypothetical protein
MLVTLTGIGELEKKKGGLMDKFVPSAMFIVAGVIGIGSGRLLPTLAAVVGLVGVILGGLALAQSAGRIGAGNGRRGAIGAGIAGSISVVVGGLHSANSAGGFGTGNGLAGAIIAIVVGLISIALCSLVLARSQRLHSETQTEADTGDSALQSSKKQ